MIHFINMLSSFQSCSTTIPLLVSTRLIQWLYKLYFQS